ncbi:HPr family phosphocarrier protein [Candidatus Desulfarcum epimagneticum]|uniref:HPr family phosphocarrier protein n=1 Tax=uncultured Desulfobacteraceae bacterium TaxID=218296 RepID=A0A484HJI8_9BACT|nr:HPr family phosphocarrier protein [uncultured Desulfobacteraceae bacterium]
MNSNRGENDGARSGRAVVPNALGLHARAAAKIAAISGRARGNVWLWREEERADAKSIVDMLILACARGTEVAVSIENEKDAGVLSEIIKTIEAGFGE